jgi:TetR/AcrR family transcriptional regulator, transcriptional repressor for nem operon
VTDSKTDTKSRLLDVATALVQTRGFHGFSFHDLADAIGIKTASIHYHFPTKADLGQQMVQRYTKQFMERLGPADDGTPRACLMRYADLFRGSLTDHKMCLCGMVGAEITGMPDAMTADVQAFFAVNRDWLSVVLARAGIAAPDVQASVFLATLEGALMIARVSNDPVSFDAVVDASIDRLLA